MSSVSYDDCVYSALKHGQRRILLGLLGEWLARAMQHPDLICIASYDLHDRNILRYFLIKLLGSLSLGLSGLQNFL